MPERKSVVITDLDNTLFDWFEIWYQSFTALLDCLAKDSGRAFDDGTTKQRAKEGWSKRKTAATCKMRHSTWGHL